MRLLLATNAYGPATGGVRTTIDTLRRLYAAAGHEAALLFPGATHGEGVDEYGPLLRVQGTELPWNRAYRNIFNLRAARRVIDRLRPDAIEIHDKWTLPRLARPLAADGRSVLGFSLERLDCVLRPYLGDGPLLARTIRRYNRWFAAQFETVVCHSQFAAAELAAAGAGNVVVLPLGVDLATFTPAARDEAWRAAMLDGRPRLLAYVGRLVPEKNVALLGEAMRRLEAAEPGRYRLVIAGGGPEAARLSTAPATRYLGFVRDRAEVARIYASADALLFPSSIEAFGLTVIEALACGCPVAAAAGGGCDEVLVPRVGVRALPTAAHLAAAVPVAMACDRAAARRVAAGYRWELLASRLLDLHRAGGAR